MDTYKWFWVVIVFLATSDCFKDETSHVFNVGGIFKNEVQKRAFITALQSNNEKSFLTLSPITYLASEEDTLEIENIACHLLSEGIIALFGPSSVHSSPYIHSICDLKEIPHIETNCDPEMKRSTLINLHPSSETFSNVFSDIIEAFQWQRIMVLYDNEDMLLSVSSLVKLNLATDRTVVLKQLQADKDGSYRDMLKDIRYSGERSFVIACSTDTLENVFKQLQQVGMITDRYSYLISSMDLHILDLTSFQYADANITGVRMVSPHKLEAIETMKEGEEPLVMDIETALVFDAVQLLYETLRDLINLDRRRSLEVRPMDCRKFDYWTYGYSIVNLMRTKVINGLTGPVKFDIEGFRKDFVVDVLGLYQDGLVRVGGWNSSSRQTTFHWPYRPTITRVSSNTQVNPFNRTFVVLISITPPYGMLKETTTQLSGNDRYEGYGIDVIQELSKILGFNYTLELQEDGVYGNFDKNTNEWNGMLRKIMDGRADLAITDLTVTSERENAVDFTMPFMSLGISILYRKPEPVPPSLFMFVSPFSTSVWVMLCVSYLIVSISFFVMGRLSPQEWQNPYPCIEEPKHLENQYSMRNAFWGTMGALMQQGSELAPVAISTRTASGAWWFFVLIITSSYTANLAAFLTVETLVTPFKDIGELASQTEIKYGAKIGGATVNFFRDSNVSIHQQVWHYLQKHKDEVLLLDNDAGVAKVETENYAFLMESTSIEYVTERHCTLASVGGLLDEKGYGIAMKKNSEYRGELSEAVLQLQEQGVLTKLKIKWWKEKRGGGKCSAKSDKSETTPLDLQHLGGVFLVLLIGTILGMLGSLAEIGYAIYRKTKAKDISFEDEFRKELRFFVNFKQNVRDAGSTSDSISRVS